MLRIVAFSKYAAAVLLKGRQENDLALGMIESIVKMGKPQHIHLHRQGDWDQKQRTLPTVFQ